MDSNRRLANAIVVSVIVHFFFLVALGGMAGSRSGKRHFPGLKLVELIQVSGQGAEARVTEDISDFRQKTDNRDESFPRPLPSLTDERRQGEGRSEDRPSQSDLDRPTDIKPRLQPGKRQGQESVTPAVSQETELSAPSPAGNVPVRPSGDESLEVTSPRCASCPSPSYPAQAQRRELEGEVVVRFQILEDGTVGDIFVEKSSGYPILDEAALAGVKNWNFYPATQEGRPVTTTISRAISFYITPR